MAESRHGVPSRTTSSMARRPSTTRMAHSRYRRHMSQERSGRESSGGRGARSPRRRIATGPPPGSLVAGTPMARSARKACFGAESETVSGSSTTNEACWSGWNSGRTAEPCHRTRSARSSNALSRPRRTKQPPRSNTRPPAACPGVAQAGLDHGDASSPPPARRASGAVASPGLRRRRNRTGAAGGGAPPRKAERGEERALPRVQRRGGRRLDHGRPNRIRRAACPLRPRAPAAARGESRAAPQAQPHRRRRRRCPAPKKRNAGKS